MTARVRLPRPAPAAVLALALVAGCGAGGVAGGADGAGGDGDGPATSAGGAAAGGAATGAGHPGAPPAGVVVDYQLARGYPAPDGVGGVVRDVTDAPEPGLWSACYVNGFQTQPGDRDAWLADHPDLVLRDDAGEPVADEGWPDEMLLDTGTAEQRAALAEVLGEQVRACAERGFAAVELDNLDSWTRSGGRLGEDGAVDLAARLVAVAHDAGLAAGQKNTPQLGTRGRDEAGFDFAVAEECAQYDECAAYTGVYGDAVLDIEYTDEGFAAACADPGRPSSTIRRDRDLSTPDDPAYVFGAC
ncbi:endo alpha-1,4 polygalactosaminidase [Cellulomonas sp.]|uniref:endo alpha-1,4 polygalactosaminidase n=1 Tax=Cellulomonas sp. TaxID=40001 RepID=UPI002D6B1C7E|nr:endo alpha-1,4 polygalactosaminidase [Cellulomonas sp.]HYQ75881.1 endo alpha-1,4 polygalactosaminidase [Cellulomonas sp.]